MNRRPDGVHRAVPHRARAAAGLFPSGVAFVEASAEMYDAPLPPDEEAAIARAGEQRRRTFRAGRACARAALARVGVVDAVIPTGANGQPIWPRGTVGAITHCRDYCAAAVASLRDLGGVGLDAERRRRVDGRLADRVCTPGELERMRALGDLSEWATIGFSAKEAGFKVLHPLTGIVIPFADAEVDVDVDDHAVTVRMVNGRLQGLTLSGHYRLLPRVVVTGVSLTPGEARALATQHAVPPEVSGTSSYADGSA